MSRLISFTLLFVLFTCTIQAQTARVQIIHNAPTPTVDVYAGTAKLLDDFVFRTATPYIDVPAGVQIPIGVALGTSQSSADAIATFPVQFEAGKTYVVVATGIVGGNPGFTLKVFDQGKETTADPANTGILFFHGSPDAPTVDVVTGGQPIINNASYGDFQGYLEVPAASYDLSVTPGNDNNTIVAKYKADLSFWKGRTAVIFASGFLSGKDPGFEPWVALSTGGTFPLQTLQAPPPATVTGAKIQIIHNSPTPTVDIYAGADKLLDNFAFRTATPYVDVPAGVSINIGVALANSQSSADAIANFPVQFESGKRYVVVATGVVGGNPGFTLKVFDQGKETVGKSDVGILFYHGSPDAPGVDIVAGGQPVFDNVSYGNFSGYVTVPAASYILGVTPENDNNNILAKYKADFGFWAGRTLVVFASGFLGGGAVPFEPWVALSNGGTFPLAVSPNLLDPSVDDRAGTSAATVMSLYPNPVTDQFRVNFTLDQDSDVQYTIVNAMGQVVQNQALGMVSKGEQTIDVACGELVNNQYFMVIRTDKTVKNLPFVVLR